MPRIRMRFKDLETNRELTLYDALREVQWVKLNGEIKIKRIE